MDETLAGTDVDPPGKSRALALALEADIAGGRYRPGDRLPSIRQLSSDRGVAANTVAAAYRRLAERGLVEGRGRAGTIVSAAARPTRTARPNLAAGVVDLSAGNPDPRLLPDWQNVLRRIADAREIRLYGEAPIADGLAEVIRRDFARDSVDPEHLCLVSGALDGLERLLSTNLRHGDRVAVEDPGYRPVRSLLAALGLRAVPVPVDSEGMLPGPLAVALDSGVEAIVITPRAQNPVGAALTSARAHDLAEMVSRHPGLLTIEDDHAGPVAGMPLATISHSAQRWAVIRSAAKSYGPDLRLAAVAGDNVTIDRVSARLAAGMGWVPHLLQEVALGLMIDSEVSAGLEVARSVYAGRRDRFSAPLLEAGILLDEDRPRSGFNVWVPVEDEGAVVAAMLGHGFSVTPGAAFRLEASPAIRVSVAQADDEVLDRAAATLVQAIVGPAASARSV